MSISVMAKIWEADCGSHTSKLVLLAIADHADDKGVAWPSITGIADKCNLTRRGVINQVQKLSEMGLISTKKTHGRNTKYTIKLVNDVHQCIPFTSEPCSKTGERGAPTGERGSPEPSITIRTTKKREEKKETVVSLPFDSPQFLEAWDEWKQFRKESRKPLTPSTASKQLKTLERWGERKSIESINQSIECGWQGLFEPKNRSAQVTLPKPRQARL